MDSIDMPKIPQCDSVCSLEQLMLISQYVYDSGRMDLVEAVCRGSMSVTDAAREVAGEKASPVAAWGVFSSLWAEASPQDQAWIREKIADLVGLVEPQINGGKVLFPKAASAKISVGRKKPTEAEFEAFWKAYPRRTEKGNARKAFEKAFTNLREQLSIAGVIDKIMSGVDAYAANADPEFLCHPATWLNGCRWDDDAGSIGKTKKKSHSDFGKYDPEAEDLPW